MGASVRKKKKWLKRKRRVRRGLKTNSDRPRLTVFRSASHIYGQVVDDVTGTTLACASSVEKFIRNQPRFENKVALAGFVGKLVAERAIGVGIKKVVFDRNGFFYHGRIKALSDGARKAGLVF